MASLQPTSPETFLLDLLPAAAIRRMAKHE
jgi:hypothetical protein